MQANTLRSVYTQIFTIRVMYANDTLSRAWRSRHTDEEDLRDATPHLCAREGET